MSLNQGRRSFLKLAALLFAFTITFNSLGQDLREMVYKAENRLRGKSSISLATITIVRPKYEREMTIMTWTKTDDYNLMYIMTPARDKGTVYLKRKKRDLVLSTFC